MAKGSVITEGLFQTVKQLQEIHRDYKAEQLAPLVCREATVVRRMMKCATWEEYCEYKKAKAEKERIRVEKRKQAEEPAEDQVPGQMRMDLVPPEMAKDYTVAKPPQPITEIQLIDQDKLMRFQAAQVDKLILKIDRLNDTMSMILRAIRKE